MAIGRQPNSSSNLSILKIKVKNEAMQPVDPYFQVTKKVDGKWQVVSTSENFVSGQLTRLANKTTEYNGEKIQQVEALLQDGDEAFLLDLKFTLLNRGLINSFLSLTDLDTPVEISLYTSKSGYPSAAVRQNGELIRWKFSIDEQPKPEVVVFKGKEQRDYTPVDNFFIDKIDEFSAKAKPSGGTAKAEPAESEEVAPDEIPF